MNNLELKEETLQNWINQIKLSTSPSVIPDMYVEEIKDFCLISDGNPLREECYLAVGIKNNN